MGAEQSSPRNDEPRQFNSTSTKTCYYELLGLDRQATDDEIRKAYKKKALELHPDRNLSDVENATRKFAQVQTAYEILSDPQERAWYDSHRDAILAGDDGSGHGPSEQYNIRLTSAEDIFALMGRFNSTVPMTDSPTGFFGILNAFFDHLALEEAAACEWEGQVSMQYPPFGSANDDHDVVAKPFYNVWSAFSTKKLFSWKDKYRLSEAEHRQLRRLMEKENKKLREEAIRDFNDAVRSLVAFVKKRDPRYVSNTQSEAERQKVLRDSAAAQAARSRAANQEKLGTYIVPDWAQSRKDDDHDDEFSVSEEESEVEHIECVVCNKVFKSEKQFGAHEKSKKHVKAVQQLRRQMKREDADYVLGVTVEDPNIASGLSRVATTADHPDSLRSESHNPGGEEKLGFSESPNVTSANATGGILDSSGSDGDDTYALRSKVENRLGGESLASENVKEPTELDTESLASGLEGVSITVQSVNERGNEKVGKAKAKREKKAAKEGADESVPGIHICAACKQVFSSRTKLFSHIKELGHAAPVPQAAKGGKKQRK